MNLKTCFKLLICFFICELSQLEIANSQELPTISERHTATIQTPSQILTQQQKERMVMITSMPIGLDDLGKLKFQQSILLANVPLPGSSEEGLTYADLISDIISDEEPGKTRAFERLCYIYFKNISKAGVNLWPIVVMNILNCRNHKDERLLIRRDSQTGLFCITEKLDTLPLKLFFVGMVFPKTLSSISLLLESIQLTPPDSEAFSFFDFPMGIETDLTPLIIGKMPSEFAYAHAKRYSDIFIQKFPSIPAAEDSQNSQKLLDFMANLKKYQTRIEEIKISFDSKEILKIIEILRLYLSKYLPSKYEKMPNQHCHKLVSEIESSYQSGKWLVQESTFRNAKNEIRRFFMPSFQTPRSPKPSKKILPKETFVPKSNPLMEDFDKEKNNFEVFVNFIKIWSLDDLDKACCCANTESFWQNLSVFASSFLSEEMLNPLISYMHFLKYSFN